MFMTKSGLPNSVRKFIRREKARIRGGILNIEEQKEQIAELYEKYSSGAKAVKHAAKSHTVESVAVKPAAVKKRSGFGKKTSKKVTSEKRDKAKAKKLKK